MAQTHSCRVEVCLAGWRLVWGLLLLLVSVSTGSSAGRIRAQHELLNPQGVVEVLRKGANAWTLATTNLLLLPGDTVRTGKDSRAAVRLSNHSVIRMDRLTVMPLPG